MHLTTEQREALAQAVGALRNESNETYADVIERMLRDNDEFERPVEVERTFSIDCARFTKSGYRLCRKRVFVCGKVQVSGEGQCVVAGMGRVSGTFFHQLGNIYFAHGVDHATMVQLAA